MAIHKEGYKILLWFFLIFLLINLGIYLIFSNERHIIEIAIGTTCVLYLFSLWFFRKPRREFIMNDNCIFAPADGKVVVIEETIENEYFNEKRIQVSIFMSILDVHINHYPMSGLIKYVKYNKGRNIVAWHPKSSFKNERSSVVIENSNNIEIMVRQIAGAVARRIVSYAKVNKNVVQGDELGFIKFGSRVDLFLPLEVILNVRIGQKVFANKTVLAKLKK